jgi:hypothetical protein
MENPYGFGQGYAVGRRESAEARATFIVRTYIHLFGAILAFTAIEVYLFQSGLAYRLAASMLSVNWLIILGGFVVVSWLASHVAQTATALAAQYLALGFFVVAEAIIFVPLLVIAQIKGGGGVLESAALLTLVGFGGLTAGVFITRKDFSALRGVLCAVGSLALVTIVAAVLFGLTLGTWFSIAMIAFACGAILYDTSNILHHYPEDRYVGAALELFASVALLFWYIIRLFMSRE